MKARIIQIVRQSYKISNKVYSEKKFSISALANVSASDIPISRTVKTEKTDLSSKKPTDRWQRLILSGNSERKERAERRASPTPDKLLTVPALIALSPGKPVEEQSTPEQTPKKAKPDFNEYTSRIRKNDPTLLSLDLSDLVLSDSQIMELGEAIKSNNQLGHIIWGLLPTDNLVNSVIKTIEDKIIENNRNFRYKPSDFELSLLSKHAYEELTDANEERSLHFALKASDSDELKAKKKRWEAHLVKWKVHKVYNDRDKSGYFGVAYINEETKQVILAHRGTDVKLSDLFRSSSPGTTDIEAVYRANPFNSHMAEAYISTDDIIKKVKTDEGILRGYHITFTGHSLGAWFAEMSVYYCYRLYGHYFQQSIPRAVVFDSPGTKSMFDSLKSNVRNPGTKFEEESLDIVTYLSVPNPVNICNQHMGTVYTVFPTIESSEGFVKTCVEFMASKDRVKGLESLATHSLEGVIDQLDPENKEAVKYKEVKDWPLLARNLHIAKKSDILSSITSVVSGIVSSQVPVQAKIIVEKTVDEVLKEMLKDTTLENIAELLDDLIDGRVDIDSFFKLQQYLDENYREKKDLTIGQQFYLVHGHHYNIVDICNLLAVGSLEGTVNWHLRQIHEFKLNERANSTLVPISRKLLEEISAYYDILNPTIGSMGKAYIRLLPNISPAISIDELKQRFCRLMEVDEAIVKLINDRNNTVTQIPTNRKLLSHIVSVKRFTSRNAEIQTIHDCLQSSAVALYGHTGSGKSVLAAKYGEMFSKAKDNNLLFIIEENKAEEIFFEIAKALFDPTGLDSVEIKKKVYDNLQKVKQNILLIFDNVDSEYYTKQVSKYFRDKPENVKIIITTKSTEYQSKFEGCVGIRVVDFTFEEAVNYIKSGGKIPGSDKEIEALIRTVGTVIEDEIFVSPKRLRLVESAFIKPHPSDPDSNVKGSFDHRSVRTIPEYITLYQSIKKDGKEHPEFEIVLGLLFKRASIYERLSGNLPAWQLLQYCTFLNPDFIPFELFEELGYERKIVNEAFDKLASLGLWEETETPDKSRNGVKIHRLDIEETKQYRSLHKRYSLDEEEIIERIWSCFSTNFPFIYDLSDPSRIEKSGLFADNVRIFIDKLLTKGEASNKVEVVMGNYSSYLYNTSRYVEALEFLEMTLDKYKSLSDKNNLYLAKTLGNMCEISRRIGRLEKAFEYGLEAHRIFKGLYGSKSHPDIAACLIMLGTCRGEAGDYPLSIQDLSQAKAMYEDLIVNLIKEHNNKLRLQKEFYYKEKIAECFDKIGVVKLLRSASEEMKEGIDDIKTGLKMKLKLYNGIYNADIVSSYNNLGGGHTALFQNLRNTNADIDIQNKFFNKATKYLEKALELGKFLHAQGKLKDEDLADIYNNLGCLYLERELFKKSLSMFEESGKIYDNLFGKLESYYKIAKHNKNIGTYYCKVNNLKTGMQYLSKSLQMNQKTYPKQNHNDLYDCLVINGTESLKLTDPEVIGAWLPVFKEAAENWKNAACRTAKDNDLIAGNSFCIGAALEKLGKLAEAQIFFQEAYNLSKEVKEENSPDTKKYKDALAQNNFCIGEAFEQCRNFSEAQQSFKKAYELLSDLKDEDSPEMIKYKTKLDSYDNFWQKMIRISEEVAVERYCR